MKVLKVAAYCRVSTDKEEQVNSLENQRNYFTEYIKKHEDWTLVKVFYDEGISGTQTENRSGFHHMMEEAFLGNIDLILTKEVSRFARNTVDTLSCTRRLKEHGVGVIFTMDNIDTRESDGEFRLTIMAGIAQEESHKISERVKWGQKRRMEQGVVFGRDLLGYTVMNGKLLVNEEEVPIVRAIFHKYTNEGKGTHVIAKELLAEGMSPKQGRTWSNVVILRVLRNEKYVGDLCQKKTITPDYLTHKKKYNHGEEEMVYLKDHHSPIIDRDLWNRTQEELKKRSFEKGKREKYSNRYWCSGKLYCGLCGNRFVSRRKTYGNGTVYKAWRCHEFARHGRWKLDDEGKTIGCDSRSYSEQVLLSAMKYVLQSVVIDWETVKEEVLSEIKFVKTLDVEEGMCSRIEKKLGCIYEKKRKLLDLFLENVISREKMEEQTEWYDRKIEGLEQQLLQNQQLKQGDKRKSLGKYQYVLDEICSSDNSELLYPELLFKEVLEKMILFPEGTIEIYFKGIHFGIQLKCEKITKNEYRFLEKKCKQLF